MKSILHIRRLLGLFCLLGSYSAFSQVSGIVYQDFNANGNKDNNSTYNEIGLAGVKVIATKADGTILSVSYIGAGASTNSSGGYNVSGGVLGQIRLEFVLPNGYSFASKGASGGTTIMFPNAANQDLAVYSPDFYNYSSNPRVASQVYTNGNNQISGSGSAQARSLVTFPFKNNEPVHELSNLQSIGATWGLAYHKQSKKLFSAAFAKRHVNTGSLGLNGIYVTTNPQATNNTSSTNPFVNLNSVNPAFDAGSVVRNFGTSNGSPGLPNHDERIFNEVGKIGMGDLDVSDDGRYLYTINLKDRRLWRIEVGVDGVIPTSASQIVPYPAFPDPCVSSTFRPFAIKYHRGFIYVGGICDGVNGSSVSSSINRNNLKATVYKIDASGSPASGVFTEVLDFPLTYNRNAHMAYGGAGRGEPYKDPNNPSGTYEVNQGAWHPWVRSFEDFFIVPYYNTVQHSQPILMDLEFDVDGSMILGFGDRTGHQIGNSNYGVNLSETEYYTTVAGGDLLRATYNNGSYQIENNGKAGSKTTQGAGNSQGPGGGEFYFEDYFSGNLSDAPFGVNASNSGMHEETSQGGLALMAGSNVVMQTVMDPRVTNDFTTGRMSGGVRWYSNDDGRVKDGVTLYDGFTENNGTFGKASGVGDLELLSDLPPIEIGNRVWLDSNNNGIQDAGETGISGITVTLYSANGTSVLGTATTNAQGEYYFSSAIGTSTTHAIYNLSILPGATYVLSFPTSSGGHDISTNVNAGSNDLIDTDANDQGRITFTTGSSGENNHSFDVGYYSCPTVPAPTSVAASPANLCSGSSTLSASCATGSPIWYTNASASTPLIGGTTVSPISNTPYYVRCESGACYSTIESITITVTTPPAIAVSSPAICSGQTATLTVTGCTGGNVTWSGGLTAGSTTTTPALTSDRTYTATCTMGGGCTSTTIATVNVTPSPTITAGPAVCATDGLTYSVTFTIPTGATLTTTSGTVSENVVSEIPSGVTATITVTSAEGCTNTTTVMQNCTIPCNAPNPTVTGDLEICAGESTTLTASGCTTGYTYLWSTAASTAAITVTPSANTTYTVKCVETGRPECESINPGSASVVVNPIPTITAGTPVCATDGLTYSVTFTIPAGATIASTSGTVSGNVVSEIPSGVTATITVTSAEGCTNTTTVMQNCTIPCNAPNPTVTGDLEVCAGESTTLTASGCTTGYTYLWSTGATTAAITVTPAANTTYTVKCVETGRPECESINPGSASVVVNPIPTITAGPAVCATDGLTYSVTFTIPTGATIASTSGTVSGNVVSGINSGVTATITVTSSEGCTNTTTVMQNCTIPCNAPNPTVTGDLEICAGESTTLTASGCTTGYTYLWSTAATTAAITVTPSTNTTYTVKCVETGRPECESINPGSASVVVNPIPTITAGPAVCAVDGLTYSVTFTIPAGATLTTTSGTVNGNVVSGITSVVTATITVTSAEGCTNTTTVMQNCTIPCNAPNPTVTGDLEVCAGESTTLTANGCTTGYTYLWSTAATTATITVTPTANTTYTVKCVETGRPECESINPGSASVVVNPIPTITAGPAVCATDGLTYSVTFTIPAGATIASTAGTVSGNVVSEITSGVTATITVTSAEGCTNTTTVNHNCTVPIFDLALRKVMQTGGKNPTVQPGDNVTFTIEVINQGTLGATNIEVVDYIPTGLILNDANWTQTGATATLNTPIASLAPGATTTRNITFTVAASARGSIINTAEISDAKDPDGNDVEDVDSTPDDDPNNDGPVTDDEVDNENDDEDDHDQEEITVKVFDLALRKTLTTLPKGATVTPGSIVDFTVTVINQGNVDATNISLVDYIPAGLTLADLNWTASGGNATLITPIAALAAGATTTRTISFTVNAGFSGSIRNFAEISGADNADNLEDIDSTPDNLPGNDGTPKDDVVNEDHKNNPTQDEDDHDYEDITVTPTPLFDLALRKTMAAGSKTIYKVGDVVTFDITVFNQGTITATSVDMVDYIPTGLTLQVGSDWTLDGDKARWIGAISNLAPGEQQMVQISFLVNASATGVIINTAEISGATNPENLEDIDSTPDDEKDNDGPVKNDEINEDGKNVSGEDEDDHDIESITICLDAKCITVKTFRNK